MHRNLTKNVISEFAGMKSNDNILFEGVPSSSGIHEFKKSKQLMTNSFLSYVFHL